MRVLLGISHALLREGLQLLLKRWSDIEIVGAAPSTADAAHLAARLQPDVLVLARGERPAEDAQAILDVRGQCPSCHVLMVEGVGRRSAGEDLGADCSLRADVGATGLVRALWDSLGSVDAHGGRPAAPPTSRPAGGTPPRVLLTRRECEVVRAVCEGLGNKAVARRLAISEKTVRNHLSSIYRRTKVSGRTQLLLWAMRQGLCAEDPPS